MRPVARFGMVLCAGAVLITGSSCRRVRELPVPRQSPQPPKSATADGTNVRVQFNHVDGDGAMFLVKVRPPPAEPEATMVRSTLVVDGTPWPNARWETLDRTESLLDGELFFAYGGPVRGEAIVAFEGLPGSPKVAWDL